MLFFGGEREIRLSAGTGEFTRVSGACNGEFSNVVAGGTNAAESLLIKQKHSCECCFLAEKERFELSNRFSRLHDFQSCALDQLGDFSKRY